MAGIRFTAYLSPKELTALRELADQYGTSVNLMLRLILRERFGLTIPSGMSICAVPENGMPEIKRT